MSQTYQIKQSDIVIDLPKTVGAGYGQFWRSRNLYRVVKGSRGSKKSKTTALNYVVRLLKYSWANLLVIRRYSNTNKQSTYTPNHSYLSQLDVTYKTPDLMSHFLPPHEVSFTFCCSSIVFPR
ncbi:phage terminase large subunit [Streptococcus pneumoniae]|nr:phage terminase large subunit [Streptococcus pneumoniae]